MSSKSAMLLVAVLLVIVACGGDPEPAATTLSGETATTTTIALQATTTTPAPTSTEGQGNVPSSNSVSADSLLAAADVDSYTHTLRVEFNGVDADGAPIMRSLTMVSLYQKEPPASSVTIDATGFDDDGIEGFGGLSFTVLDGTQYASVPGFGCTVNAQGFGVDSFLTGGFMTPDEVLDDFGGARRAGSTTYEGYNVDEYTFDESNVDLAPEDDIETVDGRFLYSPDLDAVLYFELDGTGARDFFDDGDVGDVRMESAISGFDEPVDIQLPEGCDESGQAATDLPMLDDASAMFSAPGLISYQTDRTLNEVVAFYQSELAAGGWVEVEPAFSAGGSTILQYELGSRTLAVTIATQGTKRLVTLIEE